MSFVFKNILWVDCVGAILTGTLLMILSGWIATLYGLQQWFVISHAFVHLAYGTFSLSLSVRKIRPIRLIKLLVSANGAWALICFFLAVFFMGNVSIFAVAHFFLEGMYVGGLALIEWNRREELGKV